VTARTPEASTVPEPFAKSPKPGLWHVEGMMLPAYVQHVAHALLEMGHAKDEQGAIKMAVGVVHDWAKGRVPNGKGHVHPDVQAAAAKADAQWQAKRATAHAQRASHSMSADVYPKWVDLTVSTAARKSAYKSGNALPPAPGSSRPRFPVTSRALYDRAVRMVQLAKGDKTMIRRYLMRKARANGWPIPKNWNPDGTTSSKKNMANPSTDDFHLMNKDSMQACSMDKLKTHYGTSIRRLGRSHPYTRQVKSVLTKRQHSERSQQGAR
jgi:hypothetical protein